MHLILMNINLIKIDFFVTRTLIFQFFEYEVREMFFKISKDITLKDKDYYDTDFLICILKSSSHLLKFLIVLLDKVSSSSLETSSNIRAVLDFQLLNKFKIHFIRNPHYRCSSS